MFTGIIAGVGTILSIDQREHCHRVLIKTPLDLSDAKLGESIAVSGVCLTVVWHGPDQFAVDVAKESLQITTLGELKVGDLVNLERALKVSDRLGGHWVQGHVDGTGILLEKKPYPEGEALTIEFPAPLRKYCVKKGSLAIEGVSLTINEIQDNTLQVFLIPHTVKATNFHTKSVGSRLNLEVDILGKYIATWLEARKIAD